MITRSRGPRAARAFAGIVSHETAGIHELARSIAGRRCFAASSADESASPYGSLVVSVRLAERAEARRAAGESAESESTPICRA